MKIEKITIKEGPTYTNKEDAINAIKKENKNYMQSLCLECHEIYETGKTHICKGDK